MPVLKSPEVTCTPYNSGLVCFEQETCPTATTDDETDVGINSGFGLNVMSHRISLYNMRCCDPETSMVMTIRLAEAWPDKDRFIHAMKSEHNVDVLLESNPFCSSMAALSVKGLKNIETLARVFRETLFETEHDGATITRQMVNPALLGEALDEAHRAMSEHRGREVDYSKYYPDYGWIR